MFLRICSLNWSWKMDSSGTPIIAVLWIWLKLLLIDSSIFAGKSRSQVALVSCNALKFSLIHSYQASASLDRYFRSP